MQFMLLIYDDPQVLGGLAEDERNRFMGDYFAYTQELRDAGAYVAGDALQGTDTATTVRLRNDEQLVTDGPFAETKEQLGGYYLIDVDSIDDAIQWAAKIPSAKLGSIEVRPVMVFDRQEVGA
jgi:hypothetical protein